VLKVRIQSKVFAVPGGAPREILRNIGFSAEPGEVIALLGPSGIGKSTILRMVLGLDREFRGSVRFDPGRLGVMFQEPRLLQWLPVEDNLRLVAPEAALGRALAVDPTTLVLDEPFASLDRSLGAALGALIADRARQRGLLVLLSTHDVDQALAISSRVLVLSGDPATLAEDVGVPGQGNSLALARMRSELLTRFTFLGLTSPDPAP
jgi:ABC-type nitrate/sulfonate/bicarbonate transport system ATPase subunit